ncbi:hypothetical protein ACF1B0_23770 [Streptomyces anandii]|uniref:hypothetical protein n=1 Tax=Streptomyces anandii TaxID=285454 RepID=UPI0036FDC92C
MPLPHGPVTAGTRWWAWAHPAPGWAVAHGTAAWEDDDCPWCRSLLDPGHGVAGQAIGRGRGRLRFPGAGPLAWAWRTRLVMVPVAALTVVAALVVALA